MEKRTVLFVDDEEGFLMFIRRNPQTKASTCTDMCVYEAS